MRLCYRCVDTEMGEFLFLLVLLLLVDDGDTLRKVVAVDIRTPAEGNTQRRFSCCKTIFGKSAVFVSQSSWWMGAFLERVPGFGDSEKDKTRMDSGGLTPVPFPPL